MTDTNPRPAASQRTSEPASALPTPTMRTLMISIVSYGQLGRHELTPGEKRTATELHKRGLVRRDDSYYRLTPAGRAALRSPQKSPHPTAREA